MRRDGSRAELASFQADYEAYCSAHIAAESGIGCKEDIADLQLLKVVREALIAHGVSSSNEPLSATGGKRACELGIMDAMIDRTGRDRAAALVEEFWAGTTTNRQLEEAWPDSKDPGITAAEDFVWCLYDDFKEQTAHEADRADPKLSGVVANCIRFLQSDEPYEWPLYSYPWGVVRYPRWAVWASLGLLSRWNKAAAVRD